MRTPTFDLLRKKRNSLKKDKLTRKYFERETNLRSIEGRRMSGEGKTFSEEENILGKEKSLQAGQT